MKQAKSTKQHNLLTSTNTDNTRLKSDMPSLTGNLPVGMIIYKYLIQHESQ